MKMHDAAGKALIDDEILTPAASSPFPGQAEVHSVPLPAVLPQQAQQVDITTTPTSPVHFLLALLQLPSLLPPQPRSLAS